MSLDITTDFSDIIRDIYDKFQITSEDDEGNKDFCKKAQKEIKLRSYQQFPAEYLKTNRGLLLDHGLGSGKTKTAGNIIRTLGIETVVLLPASLRGNFESELRSLDVSISVHFLHYNAGNLLDQYKKIGERVLYEDKNDNKFDNKLIIIEESHIFFQNVISGKASLAEQIFYKLMDAKNIKIVCLTGTPITGDPFETVPLFNLLRGYMVNKITGKKYTLFPILREEFYKNFVSTEFNAIKNKDVYQDRILGLVSYYRGILDPDRYILPEIKDTQTIECPMIGQQWISYYDARAKEWDYERMAKYKTTSFKEFNYKKAERASAGTYKTNSSQMSNFAFPEIVEKKYQSHVSNFGKVEQIADFKWKLMLENIENPFKYLYNNIAQYSSKIAYLLKVIPNYDHKKIFIYSKFQISGTLVLSKMLIEAGYEEITENSNMSNLEKKKRFTVIDGSVKNPYSLINFYNKKNNAHGEYCQIIIGTSVVQAGVSFYDVSVGFCLEPQWRSSMLTQIKGRAIRTCSHEDLEINERVVEFYILIGTVKNEERSKLSTDNGLTSDEIMYKLALKKAELLDTFINAIHEAAVDCQLNKLHNGDVDCYECANDITTPLIPFDYMEHIVNGSKCTKLVRKVNLLEYMDKNTGDRYMKDDANNLYQWSKEDGKYVEVGFIKYDEVILF